VAEVRSAVPELPPAKSTAAEFGHADLQAGVSPRPGRRAARHPQCTKLQPTFSPSARSGRSEVRDPSSGGRAAAPVSPVKAPGLAARIATVIDGDGMRQSPTAAI
jgi:hypothetical protein